MPHNPEQMNLVYLDVQQERLNAFESHFRKKYTVFLAKSEKELFSLLEKHSVHAVVCTQIVDKNSGVEILRNVMKSYPDLTRIIVTENADLETIKNAVNKSHIFAYVEQIELFKKLDKVLADGKLRFDRILERKKEISKLQQQNEQLEFILQQKTIS